MLLAFQEMSCISIWKKKSDGYLKVIRCDNVIYLLWEVLNGACCTNDLLNLTTILPLSYIPPSGGIWGLKKTEVTSVQFSHLVVSDSLRPHGLQHTRIPCPSPTPRAHSNSCPSSRWCHPTISSSVIPFSSCLQSFPASGSFPMSPFLASGDQSIGVSASASVLPMNIQDWFPLGWTGLISLQSKGLF